MVDTRRRALISSYGAIRTRRFPCSRSIMRVPNTGWPSDRQCWYWPEHTQERSELAKAWFIPGTAPPCSLPRTATTSGGRFGPDFDPSEIKRPEWGELFFELECSGGRVDYQSSRPEYGSGHQQLVRLSRLKGIDCPFPLSARASIDKALWDDQFTVAGVAGKTFFNPLVLEFELLDDDRLLAGGICPGEIDKAVAGIAAVKVCMLDIALGKASEQTLSNCVCH